MSTYAIGDVQGCLGTLKRLLRTLPYDENKDELWFAGDLINRGPATLQTLRFIHARKDRVRVVLGNHDLHALACAAGYRKPKGRDTLAPLLEAPDRDVLLSWLAAQPLIYEARGFFMVHAGLHPTWSLDEARSRARAVEAHLSSERTQDALLAALQKKESAQQDSLLGGPKARRRLQESLAVLTRIRLVDKHSKPNYTFAGPPEEAPKGQRPWFHVPHPDWASAQLIFGHWAALGRRIMPGLWGLDSGCVWGNTLTAIRLEDGQVFEAAYEG